MWPADKAMPTVYLPCVRWVLNAQRQITEMEFRKHQLPHSGRLRFQSRW